MQTPFMEMTAMIEIIAQTASMTIVKMISALVILDLLDFVCVFHRIVGKATIQTMMRTASIS